MIKDRGANFLAWSVALHMNLATIIDGGNSGRKCIVKSKINESYIFWIRIRDVKSDIDLASAINCSCEVSTGNWTTLTTKSPAVGDIIIIGIYQRACKLSEIIHFNKSIIGRTRDWKRGDYSIFYCKIIKCCNIHIPRKIKSIESIGYRLLVG